MHENDLNIDGDHTQPLSLRSNFAWTLVGNLVYSACQWGMLVVVAKIVSPQGVGEFALGLAVTAPIFMFTNLQLRAIQATDARGEYRFSDYLGLRLTLSAAAFLALGLVVWTAGYPWRTAVVVTTIGVAKGLESISDVFYGLFQQRERMDRIATSMLIKGPSSLLALGACILMTKNVAWGTVTLAATWATVLVLYDIRVGVAMLRATRRPESDAVSISIFAPLIDAWQDKAALARLARLAFPLGIVTALISLNGNIPRYFVERYHGEGDLGIFAALAYVGVAGSMVVNALGQSAVPRLARYYAEGDHNGFRTLTLRLVAIGFLLGLLGLTFSWIAARQVLTLLYTPLYAERNDVFLVLMIAAAISYVGSFVGYSMTAARYFRIQAPLFAFVAGATTLACALLVPRNGLLGAAQASVLTSVLALAGALFINLHALRRLASRAARESSQ